MKETIVRQPNFSYSEITGSGGTVQVSSAPGFLHEIIINNAGSAWEVDIYDGFSSAATLTEANKTNFQPIPIAKLRGTTLPMVLPYDVPITQGIFLDFGKGTTVGDLTITFL